MSDSVRKRRNGNVFSVYKARTSLIVQTLDMMAKPFVAIANTAAPKWKNRYELANG